MRTEFKEARRSVLNCARPLEAEEVGLREALWRTLAEDVTAADDVPAADNSAMDGFALRAEETAGASQDTPVALRIAGEIAAGPPPGVAAGPGEAARIMTGGVMPEGADAVVMVEKVEEREGEVLVCSPVKTGLNVRRKGEDINRGDTVYKRGEYIGPAELGVLASIGRSRVRVYRRPTVAILTTGSELIEVDEELLPGRVRSSNTYTLIGQVREAGGKPMLLGNAADSPEELQQGITKGYGADVLVTSGGVSAGKFDLLPKAAEKMGEVIFRGVGMKPGAPVAFGRIGGMLWFGLPGNPVASVVCFEEFVRPALLKMGGRREVFRPEVEVRCGAEIRRSPDRVHFVRVTVKREGCEVFAYPTREQGSGILTSVSLADGLLVVRSGDEPVRRGRRLRMQVLRGERWLREIGNKE